MFSRTWTVPQTILQLNAGNIAMKNISFLISDDLLASEPVIIGIPVLAHLRIDTKTLLEQNVLTLDGTDCSRVGNPTTNSKGGFVSRLMHERKEGFSGRSKSKHGPSTHVNYHTCRTEKDPFPDPALLEHATESTKSDIKSAIQKMLREAKDNGLPDVYHRKLEQVVWDNEDVLCLELSAGPPAHIPPLKIVLTQDSSPVKVKLRNYSEQQREFMKGFVDGLVEKGMAYPNPTARWASAPLLVPKHGKVPFRFTVDLRHVNKFTAKSMFPMPVLDHEMHKLAGSNCYGNFDLSHAYWQLPLHEKSQECQSFITPDGVYTPPRVLHGTANAVARLQSSLTALFPPYLADHILSWLDDLLVHGKTVDDLVSATESVLQMCKKHNIKLHALKCILYSESARWCGRLVSAKGVKFDPRRLEGLLRMEPPTSGAHLQQFLCALQWMRTGIPNFAKLISTLHEFMELVYDRAGKRTRKSVARVSLKAVGWNEEHDLAFKNCKHALAHQCTLSHRDTSKRLCLYTDASDTLWSGVITQVPYSDVNLPHEEQRHEPLAFLSGRFNNTELGWPILEKEAYAVLASCQRMGWLLATPDGFNLYTDHNNLIFLFDPLKLVPDLSAGSVRKVLRWAVRLSWFEYVCFHISGSENISADLLGRWSAPPILRRLISIPPLASTNEADFEWPSADEVQKCQANFKGKVPKELKSKNNMFCNENGIVWIPDDAGDLQLRICIIGHTSAAGHRGVRATESSIRKVYFWSTLSDDVANFVRSCIHCVSTSGGSRVPRPFGPALHGTSASDLLQFYYLEMVPSCTGAKYLLLLRDDFSSFCWLFPFCEANAENSADAILEWSATFNTPNGLMSDGGSHFKNETVRRVCKGLRVPHHFTLPHTPWSNGGVERLGKEILRVFRSVLSELRLDHQEWPSLLHMVQSALNNSPSPERGNMAPIAIFTGQPQKTPVMSFRKESDGTVMTLSQAKAEKTLNLEKTKRLLHDLHPVVESILQRNRKAARDKSSKGVLPKFTEGDFVLVAREDFFAGEKLALRWRGPRRVTKALSDYVFTVEDLRNRFYSEKELDTEAILPHVLYSGTGMPVSRLIGLEEQDDGIYVHVRWRGLSPKEDTLEPIVRVYEDVPKMLDRLLARKSLPKGLVQKAKAALSLSQERGM